MQTNILEVHLATLKSAKRQFIHNWLTGIEQHRDDHTVSDTGSPRNSQSSPQLHSVKSQPKSSRSSTTAPRLVVAQNSWALSHVRSLLKGASAPPRQAPQTERSLTESASQISWESSTLSSLQPSSLTPSPTILATPPNAAEVLLAPSFQDVGFAALAKSWIPCDWPDYEGLDVEQWPDEDFEYLVTWK